MNVTVTGSGYIGLNSGACSSERGNKAAFVDIDQIKIEKLNKGIIPVLNPYWNKWF